MMLRKLIGDRAFYRHCLAVAIPIIIQNAITNFVALLDNIMVGQVGTLEMSGVAIVNQLIFVFNLCIFGATSGAGIFTAQFHGNQDITGVRRTFRFKFLAGVLLATGGIALFCFAGTPLIQLYLEGDITPQEAADTLRFGLSYLSIMLFGLPAFALSTVYSGTLRETGQVTVPMISGIIAVLTNLILNFILIFGYFGAPAMGIRGAAVATVVSRYVELLIVALWTHRHRQHCPFIVGAYRSMHISAPLFKQILLKGTPLLLNEFLWASGVAFLNQCYSVRGLDAVAAINISSTLSNLSNVVFLSLGNVVGILIGQMLGSGRSSEEILDADRKLVALSVFSCLIFGGISAAFSGLFPLIYNTTDAARAIATSLILVNAAFMPVNAYNHACYFTLRSGGKTLITFLFDSGFVWVVSAPLAYLLSRLTDLPIVGLYALCLSADLIKCVIGTWMVQKGSWIQNLAKSTS